ncbi:Anaphase-promoting complex subunit 5 [Marivirga sericea]|uniref:Anaphase-promoting complex subunit 5 n=1 Tax=Marivirga sericea TaxID=1028 RepID=A0A1X7LF89_9BACT|nr:sensor histidine kinase [Marivirga sericea]SMG52518.1 Anaphase-promoting complex subunit 5 [Marivirga sericea]
MKRLILLFFFLNTAACIAQANNNLVNGITKGPDSTRVNFILENYYKIYAQGFDEADTTMLYLIELAQKNNWEDKVAYGYLYRGVINYLSGSYENALKFYLVALKKFTTLNNDKGIGRTYNELAVFYHKTGETNKAFDALSKSYELCKNIKDLECLGTSLAHKVTFLKRKGDYVSAYPIMIQVLDIRKQMGDSIGLGYAYLDLADYEAQKGNINTSIAYIEQSTSIRKAIGDKQGLAVNKVIVGETYFTANEFEKAITYFQQTIKLAEPIGYLDLIKFAYSMIEQSSLSLGDYKEAHHALNQSIIIKDSIFSIEKAKTIAALDAQYETEKKEQQIALQTAEIAKKTAENERKVLMIIALVAILVLLITVFLLFRNRAKRKQQLLIKEKDLKVKEAQIEATLNSQESERKRFASDLHDGFGQLISALRLNMNNFNQENEDDRKLKAFEHSEKILDDMHSEIRAIAFNLMPVTLIQEGVLSAVKEFSARINKSEQLKIEVTSFELNTRFKEVFEVAIYRIIQEWVNNVLKYAEASKITIQLDQYETELILIIEDNGKGFDKNKLFKSKGNGWRNIQTRTNLIKSQIEIDSAPARLGTTFIVTAPILAFINGEKLVNTTKSN